MGLPPYIYHFYHRDIEKGDEVIIPSLTYIATANAVNYIGAKPVFCDVNLDDFQIDVSKIEKNITKKTKAILPVHLYGGVPELNQIKNIANKHNLKVIHDAAEALGSEFNKKHSVSYKDVGILSFFPNKIITTGEGGAILTNNKKIYELSRKLRAQGLKKGTDYTHDIVGYNYKFLAMSAALGFNQIDKIKRHRKSKTKIFNNYKDSLTQFGVKFQETKEKMFYIHIGLQFVFLIRIQMYQNSKNICTKIKLKQEGIFTITDAKTISQ